MKNQFRLTAFSSLLMLAIGMNTASVSAQVQAQPASLAQQVQPAHSHDGHDHQTHKHGKEFIAFQLPQWKTIHFNDVIKVKQHADMVKKLGCEVKQGQHAGHIDLTYRCTEWRTMSVETHALAEQWSGWLKASGFDVSHAHPDASYSEGKEVVEFRLVNWKSFHGKGTAEEKQFVDLLGKLGCEVVISEHAGHSDVKFRAPTWRDVHLAEHAAAVELGALLKKNSFEVAPHKH
jgi:hypothetical protein